MPEYRRRLPHFDPENAYLFLTWRLWGTLPSGKDGVAYSSKGGAFVAQDRVLDRSCYGPRWLKDTRLADLVAEAILMGAMERRFYELQAWVVMPNHVHLLILPRVPVSALMRWFERIDGQKRQPDSGPHRPAVLAGRILRSLSARYQSHTPDNSLH